MIYLQGGQRQRATEAGAGGVCWENGRQENAGEGPGLNRVATQEAGGTMTQRVQLGFLYFAAPSPS